jgi:hypothetical protein
MKPSKSRRWGEKLRKEIEEAGGIDAWERRKGRKPPRVPPPAPADPDHPLAGSLLTERGLWNVSVLKDENLKDMRVFTLSLSPPKTPRGSKPIAFGVRVPLTVIRDRRPKTWAADLRASLTSWINSDALPSREKIWSPPDD